MSDRWRDELFERGPRIVANFYDNIGQGETVLVSPACERGCPLCVRECAVRRITSRWWERELAKARAEQGLVLSHDGIVYAEPLGRA